MRGAEVGLCGRSQGKRGLVRHNEGANSPCDLDGTDNDDHLEEGGNRLPTCLGESASVCGPHTRTQPRSATVDERHCPRSHRHALQCPARIAQDGGLVVTYRVIDISHWNPDRDEKGGARDKMWVLQPGNEHPSEALWKEGRPGEKIAEPGADLWAERVAAEIAPLMGVRAAHVDLAVWGAARGIVSWRIPGTLRNGNLLLSSKYPGYEQGVKGHVSGYDLPSIHAVLTPYSGWMPGVSAFDCFVGLLVFDALIGNTDRHHENWAIIDEDGTLAPSYDHGASLAFNEPHGFASDARIYAARGRSRHFPGRPTLVELAQTALSMATPAAAQRWRTSVSGVDTGDVRRIVEAIPAGWMSQGARTFVVEFVNENRRRLLS